MKFNKRDYLWIPGDCGEHIPIPEYSIQETETHLGIKLPESYLKVMRSRIGNSLRFSYQAPPNYPYGKYLSIADFRPIAGNGLTDSAWLCKEWGMPKNIVLLAGDGHTWLALDYRGIKAGQEPSVIFIDNDAVERIYYLAPDFASFIDNLTVEASSHYDIAFKGVGIHWKNIIRDINQLLGIELKHIENTLIYSCFHPEWQSKHPKSRAFISFHPNSQHYYPWSPEYEWLLSFDIKDPQIEASIWQKISENIPYESKKLGLSPTDFY